MMKARAKAQNSADAMTGILFFLICCTTLLSILPWPSKSKGPRILAVCPVISWIAFFIYESMIPVEMNIRVDLLILYQLLGISSIAFLLRITLIARLKK